VSIWASTTKSFKGSYIKNILARHLFVPKLVSAYIPNSFIISFVGGRFKVLPSPASNRNPFQPFFSEASYVCLASWQRLLKNSGLILYLACVKALPVTALVFKPGRISAMLNSTDSLKRWRMLMVVLVNESGELRVKSLSDSLNWIIVSGFRILEKIFFWRSRRFLHSCCKILYLHCS